MPGRIDEDDLIRRAKAGDRVASGILVERNRGAIERAVHCMRPADRETADDLRQDGAMGVLEAIRRWDPEIAAKHNSSFFTYAMWWIRAKVQDGADRQYGSTREESGVDLSWKTLPDPPRQFPDLLASLPDDERAVMQLVYGLDGQGERTFSQAGQILGRTHREVSRLHGSALQRLRESMPIRPEREAS